MRAFMIRRRLSRGLSFLILLLTVMFSARELPELLTLADDVANEADFVVIVPDETSVKSALSAERVSAVSTSLAAPVNLPRLFALASPPTPPTEAGQARLRLLSLQRK